MDDFEDMQQRLNDFDWWRPMSVEDVSQFQSWLKAKKELIGDLVSNFSDDEISEMWDSEWGTQPRSNMMMESRKLRSLKRAIREAYEDACESVDDEGIHEEQALEEYLNEKKSMRLGGGGRFAKFVKKLKDQGKSEESAKAIAASVGRKKYGKAKMAQWASAGRKRASKEE